MTNISAKECVLFARNTGSLYQTHLALARVTNTDGDWLRHIEREVIPAYRRDLKNPHARMTSDDKLTAAADLRAYYGCHIREF